MTVPLRTKPFIRAALELTVFTVAILFASLTHLGCDLLGEDDTAYKSGWAVMETGTKEELKGIWAGGVDDVWAVGRGGTLIHYDGSSWTPIESGTTDIIWVVRGTAADDVWIVTSDDTGKVLHYDGASIEEYQTPADMIVDVRPISKDDVLFLALTKEYRLRNGVWSEIDTGEFWGVDLLFAGGPDDILFCASLADTCAYWDGAALSEVDADVDGTQLWYDVWGSAPGDVWLVGAYPGFDMNLLVHWNGENFEATEIPWGNEGPLYAVGGSAPNNVWAVGSNLHTRRFNGVQWEIKDGDATRLLPYLNSVFVLGNDVWAAGEGGFVGHRRADE